MCPVPVCVLATATSLRLDERLGAMHKGERLHHARQPPAVLDPRGSTGGVLRTGLCVALHCWVAPDSVMFVNIFFFFLRVFEFSRREGCWCRQLIRLQSPSDRKKSQRLALRKDCRASSTGRVTRQGGKRRVGEYRQLASLRRTGMKENTVRLVPQCASKGGGTPALWEESLAGEETTRTCQSSTGKTDRERGQ